VRLLFVLFLIFTSPAYALAWTVTGTVTAVHDGDTFRIGQQSIRLWGINAAELDTPMGPVARDALKDMIIGKQVTCEIRGRSYRRLVALCHVGGDGDDIARLMVHAGKARDWRYFSHGYYAAGT